jgi:hypothetical protein
MAHSPSDTSFSKNDEYFMRQALQEVSCELGEGWCPKTPLAWGTFCLAAI